MDDKIRCDWADNRELEKQYHDTQWGVPVHDDQRLFQLLILESMQAGLSWSTILTKWDTLSIAYNHFEVKTIANYTDKKIEELLNNPGVIRHSLKIKATISNAKAFMAIQKEFGSFDTYLWNFVEGAPIINLWTTLDQVPAFTELSDIISKDLKKRGFKFLGSTTVYAYMQAVGLVNDHLVACFRKKEIMNKSI